MINYRDYPGDLPELADVLERSKSVKKKRPYVRKKPYVASPAQVAQRHKWMVKGTLGGMNVRLMQLQNDCIIPPGKLKRRFGIAQRFISEAIRYVSTTKFYGEK